MDELKPPEARPEIDNPPQLTTRNKRSPLWWEWAFWGIAAVAFGGEFLIGIGIGVTEVLRGKGTTWFDILGYELTHVGGFIISIFILLFPVLFRQIFGDMPLSLIRRRFAVGEELSRLTIGPGSVVNISSLQSSASPIETLAWISQT